jgi:hypothetical protein
MTLPKKGGAKQSVSKLTNAGQPSRKNLTMRTSWKQLNVKKTHRHDHRRG